MCSAIVIHNLRHSGAFAKISSFPHHLHGPGQRLWIFTCGQRKQALTEGHGTLWGLECVFSEINEGRIAGGRRVVSTLCGWSEHTQSGPAFSTLKGSPRRTRSHYFLLSSCVLNLDIVVMDLLNSRLRGHLTPRGGLLVPVMTMLMGAFAFNICSQLLINLFTLNRSVIQSISPIHNSTQPFEELWGFSPHWTRCTTSLFPYMIS